MAGGAMIDALAPMPAAAMTGTGAMVGGGSPPSLQAVGRIRNVFPETWLWSNATTGYLFIL